MGFRGQNTLRSIRLGLYWLIVMLPVVLIISRPFSICEADTENVAIAVLVSLNIRPYMEAVEGLRSELARDEKIESRVFFLEEQEGKSAKIIINDFQENQFSMAVAVGPEAARFAGRALKSLPCRLIYTMILNPDEIFPSSQEAACGVSLRIPVQKQVEVLKEALPQQTTVGLIYEPVDNARFYREAALSAGRIRFRLLPICVTSPKEIPDLLAKAWKKIDYLWFIPDQTISRESLLKYIIKQAFSAKVGCIGYNQFFYESGAALSIVMDYREIGRQTAQIVVQLSAGEPCPQIIPAFSLKTNQQVVDRLGLEIQKGLDK